MQSPSAQIASQNNRSLIFISVVMAAVLLWLFSIIWSMRPVSCSITSGLSPGVLPRLC